MNSQRCRRHALYADTCVLCGDPHSYCFGDWHGGCRGGWAFFGWWRSADGRSVMNVPRKGTR